MRNYLLCSILLLFILSSCKTQETNTSGTSKVPKVYGLPEYRSAYTRKADLVNTKLFLTPLFKEKEMTGRAEITLHQHFYPSDSVTLDAKGMKIVNVYFLSGNNKSHLKYNYDEAQLNIKLPRTYTAEENFTIQVDYISQPETLPQGGSEGIKGDKGLYFVDVDSIDDSRPTQMWTQGETQSNSVWFPTIESTEQKTTSEIFITVDSAFETLSNGVLIETVSNNNGTNTWHWKQDYPAAPYLVMIAVGDFAIVKDKWNGIEVSYYVDPPYEKYARLVFGKTPEMMTFFSKLTGVIYPWQKYSQIVVHDYVSGAMENVTAVVHGTNMLQDPGSHLDHNYEHYISHELFHHWFGNLVTCRSWSNITLNEGFANYSEYLWNEYYYGANVAQSNLIEEYNQYMRAAEKSDPPLIRYQYDDREDVYDRISYNKGGCVLHMLRTYIGDSAFFKGLNIYLTKNKFSSTEVDDLRKAFEQVTGEDLNWFFNQWFLKGGHPKLMAVYKWDESKKKQIVKLKQQQDLAKNPLYRLPLDIDFYIGDSVVRKRITMIKNIQEFEFDFPVKPNTVTVDPQGSLVGPIDNYRSDEENIFLFNHSKLVRDRHNVMNDFGYVPDQLPKSAIVKAALKDPAEIIRRDALVYISLICQDNPASVKDLMFDVARHDSSPEVRATALQRIKTFYKAEESIPLLEEALNDPSHNVVATAFLQLCDEAPERCAAIAAKLEADSSSDVVTQLAAYHASNDTAELKTIFKRAFRYSERWDKYSVVEDAGKYAGNSFNLNAIKLSVDLISNDAIASSFDYYKNVCSEVLGEIQEKLRKLSSDFSKNEKKWLKFNEGKSGDNILAELSALQTYIQSKRNAIKAVK